jgi:predicted flap endonuclease-1-like 5' DNA nuclease
MYVWTSADTASDAITNTARPMSSTLTGDGAGQTVPAAPERPPDGNRTSPPRDVEFGNAVAAVRPAPSRVDFDDTRSAVERAPRSVSFETSKPAVERVPHAANFDDAVPVVDPVTDDLSPEQIDDESGDRVTPDAGPDLSGLARGPDLTAVPELGAADADRLHSAGFPTVTSLARADPSRVAEATGMTTGYAEQVIDSAAELTREGPLVTAVEGVGDVYAGQLREAGIETAADLSAAEPTYVASRTDVPPALAETLVQRAGDLEGEPARED